MRRLRYLLACATIGVAYGALVGAVAGYGLAVDSRRAWMDGLPRRHA